MKAAIMGIDVSTTASKVLVIDMDGTVLAKESIDHPISNPHPLWSEQNPIHWWESTKRAIQKVLQQVSADQIQAIGLTGQMHGLVALDENGNVLRPAILWNDGRSFQECHEINEMFGEEFLTHHLGGKLLPFFFAPKLRWLQKNEPKVFSRIAHLLLPKDYIRFCLSGEYATDVADGSGFGLMDISKREWSDKILSTLKVPASWLPSLHESQQVCASVSSSASRETGLKVGTPIVAGAGDQPAGGIGSGIISPELVSIAVGTSGVTFSITNCFQPEKEGSLNTFCHAMPGMWFYMGVSMSAGGSFRWFRDNLAKGLSYAELDKMALEVPRGSNGLLFAPYLSGERHPYSDPHLRGSFVGLTLRHDLKSMARSILEGVAFSLRDNLELMSSLSIKPTSVILTGGAANSSLWRAIIGEVLGLPIYRLQANEGASLGAAILASVGIGMWPDIPTACKQIVKKQEVENPDQEGVNSYNELYPIYRNLYPSLCETSKKLALYEERKRRS